MKKYYPKKINFTLAAFAVCLMFLVLAPSSSSNGGSPVVGGNALDVDNGVHSDVLYSVQNGNGAYAMIAYFGPGSYSLSKGHYRVKAYFTSPLANNVLECSSANLIVWRDGSAIIQCAYLTN